jgi:hypothetical protein
VAPSIAEKVRLWARVVDAKAGPLLACLEALQASAPDGIAADVLQRQCELLPATEMTKPTDTLIDVWEHPARGEPVDLFSAA